MLAGFCDAGRPELFQYPLEVTPGAIFFVLEKTPGDETLSYGDLDMEKEGPILFRENEISSLQSLDGNVCECLNGSINSSVLNGLNSIKRKAK